MDNKQKLISIIGKSRIDPEDRKMWATFIEKYPLEAIDSFLEIFSNFPDDIPWFNDLYKRKCGAFELLRQDKAKAQELLQTIFLEESTKLTEILNRS